jgi:hypothetical protein
MLNLLFKVGGVRFISEMAGTNETGSIYSTTVGADPSSARGNRGNP